MLNRFFSTCMALAMMLTVAFHAAQPVARPLTPDSGSAFSAATSDVAVAPVRKELADKPALAPEPVTPPMLLAPLPQLSLAPAEHALPDSTAPPLYPALARGPAPRAPPQA